MRIEEITDLAPWTALIADVNGDPAFADPNHPGQEEMTNKLRKSMEQQDEKILGIYGDDEPAGLFVLLVSEEDRNIEAGVCLTRSAEACEALAAYLQGKYPGFQVDFVFNPGNQPLKEMLAEKGATFEPEQQYMELTGETVPADTEGIELLTDAYYEQYCALHNKDMFWTGEKTAADPDFFRIFIAVENGQVAGYLDVTWPKEENYIFDILVAEDSRCRGWGRKLLARAIEMNRPAGMALDVNVDNEPARHLYEKMGFTRVEGKNKITATVQMAINN